MYQRKRQDLPEDQAVQVGIAVGEYLDRTGMVQSEFAERMRQIDTGGTWAQQSVSRILSGSSPSYAFVRVAAKVMGITEQELLAGFSGDESGSRSSQSVRGTREYVSQDTVARYQDLDWWVGAASACIAESGAPEYAVRAVGSLPAILDPERPTKWFVAELAQLWLRWAPLSVRRAAETERARLRIRAEERADRQRQVSANDGVMDISSERAEPDPNK